MKEEVVNTNNLSRENDTVFETLRVRREGAVRFVEISAPPMNLLGPELIRDLVAFIQAAEADDSVQVVVFESADPDYFIPRDGSGPDGSRAVPGTVP